MQSIKILVASFLLVGCSELKFPEFPKEIKNQYIVVLDKGQAYCFEFDIVSTNPYKISEEPRSVDLFYCDGLSGFSPMTMKRLTNWTDDVQNWVKQHRCQLKD